MAKLVSGVSVVSETRCEIKLDDRELVEERYEASCCKAREWISQSSFVVHES